MSVITCQNSYKFRAIWSWQISSFFLDLREIQEIAEILEIQAQICLNVSRDFFHLEIALNPYDFLNKFLDI